MGIDLAERRTAASLTVGLMFVTIALAGCTLPGGEDEPAGLKIGSLLPLTGGLADFGPAAQNGVSLAVEHVNAEGGVLGEPVVHIGENSQTDEDAATSAVARLLDVEGIHGLVGPMGSGVTLAVMDQVVAREIPMISPSNTGTVFTQLSMDSETDGWYFRTVPSDALQGWVMAKLAQDEGMLTISILAQDTPYGVGFGDVVEEQFQDRGGVVLNYIRYDPADDDFTSELEDATSPVEPDGIVVVGYPDEGETLVRDAYGRDLIGPQTEIRWFFSEGFLSQDFVDRVEAEDPATAILDGYNGTTPEQLTDDQFLAQYEAAYGGPPALFADRTYDATVLLMLAAESCQCTGGEELKDAIVSVQNEPGTEVTYDVGRALQLIRDGEDIVWTGAAGPLLFDDNHDVIAPYSVWAIIDGQITVTETGIVPE